MKKSKSRFNKVAIIGVGEIGGSIGRDLRRKRLAKEVVGVGRRRSSLLKARSVGAVDRITLSLDSGVKDADLIILATPVLRIVELGKRVAPFVKEDAIVTDVGSTKRYIVENLERIFSKRAAFVGSHPMAGSEKGGPLSATAGLFKEKACFITKTGRTDTRALRVIRQFWVHLGARVKEISPKGHDRVVAQISHAVHVIASSLVVSNRAALRHAASGFRDATRIALSDPAMWKDICLSNSREIAGTLDGFMRVVRRFKGAISRKDTARVLKMFDEARKLRRGIN